MSTTTRSSRSWLFSGATPLKRLVCLSAFTALAGCAGETLESSSSVDSSSSSAAQVSSQAPQSSVPAESSSSEQTSMSNSSVASPSFSAGKTQYDSLCAKCHGDEGYGAPGVFPSVRVGDCDTAKVPSACADISDTAAYIPTMANYGIDCTGDCATEVATYIAQAFVTVVDASDTDGDGIVGEADECPDTPADKIKGINYRGCVPDDAGGEAALQLAVNVGGPEYITAGGVTFDADRGFTGGTVGGSDVVKTIANTQDDKLYSNERYGQMSTTFTYEFAVPNGSYYARFHFAEAVKTAAGERVIDVKAENATILTNIDPFKDGGNATNSASIKTTGNFNITDGKATFDFVSKTFNSQVNAIELFRNGANADGDGDGVIDDNEAQGCAGTRPDVMVDNYGCSMAQLDKDNDDVLAGDDVCPDTPANEAQLVEKSGLAKGCGPTALATDADNDGIADVIDNCAGTLAGATVGATGCEGNFNLPTKSNPDKDAPAGIVSPQMRLTELEYTNTIKAAFGISNLPTATFLSDNSGPFKTFTTNASDKTADFVTLVNASQTLAEAIAPQYANQCNWTSSAKQCVKDHLTGALTRLWRVNNLSDGDATAVAGVIQGAAGRGANMTQAVAAGIAFAMIDDRMVYQMENGVDSNMSGKQKLTAREFIDRLSFLLANTAPDQSLVDQRSGIVYDADKIGSHADRLMAQDSYKDVVWNFVAEWLGMPLSPPEGMSLVPAPIEGDQCNNTGQCAAMYDGLAQSFDCQNSASATSVCLCDGNRCDSLGGGAMSLEASMHEETRRMVDHIVDNDLPLSELFTANYSFINSTLAEHYDVPAPATDWERYDFPASAERLGILTHASFLTGNGKHGRDVNTIFRGKIVFERLFCDAMPPPPPADQSVDLADQVSDRGTNPACSGCHSVVDPIGRMFDLYDDYGKKFASAELSGGLYMDVDIAADYSGAVEFARALPNSRAFNHCASRQLFRFAMGRDATNVEGASFNAMRDALESTGSLKSTMRALVTSDAFKNVYATPASACAVGE